MEAKKIKKITDLFKNIIPHLFGITAFFMGRVILFDTINPVIIGFLGALCFEKCFITAIICSIIGLATIYRQIFVARYIIGAVILGLFTYIYNLKGMRQSALNKSVLCGLSILLGGILFSVSEDITLFYTVLAVLEGFLAGFICYIFTSATDLIFVKEQKHTIESEELLSLSLIICCVIAGSANIKMGYTPLSVYLMLVFIFLLCHKCGFSLSISGSAIMGLVAVFSKTGEAKTIPILIMGSVFATVLSKKHKMLTPIGFAMGAVPTAWYWQPSMLTIGNLIALLLAGFTLILIPDKLYLAIAAPVDTGITRSLEYGMLVREITSSRLKSFSQSFNRLSKAINKASTEKRYVSCTKDVAALVDEVAIKTCTSCKYSKYCWEQRFSFTYDSIVEILKIFEKNGTADIDEIPMIFRQHCDHVKEMLTAISHIYEIQTINAIWQKRIAQSRDIISCQISSVAELIKGLWHDLDSGLCFDNKKSKELFDELAKYPVNIKSAVVFLNSEKRTEALITLENCYGRNTCINSIIPLVSRQLGVRMSAKNQSCSINSDNNCRLHLAESEKFRITAYGISQPKDKVCGDSYTCMHFDGGRYLLALSDGMGYGEEAREESAASIELYEEFVSAGFEKNTAINMINSVLLMRSEEDIFSTLDICTIDLYTGISEFVKIGAVSSFIVHNGRVEVIQSSTLPVGILATVETETYTKQLYPDDIIVMVTDGVIEANTNPLRREKWLQELLENTEITKPKELTKLILSTARGNSQSQKDDMTVIAARIW